MASRGRSRHTSTLTNEQLQALGCVGKDISPVTTAPPPTFPTLTNKPVQLETTSAQNYQILWKEDFLNYMRDYYLTPIPKKTTDQRYSDQYNKLLENTRAKCKSEIPWEIIPAELKFIGKRKQDASGSERPKKNQKKIANNDKVLSQLDLIDDGDASDDNTENKKQVSDSEKDDENEEIENEDDEMDDENDYGNNYFDNGEAFNEEDDNLDDGPIY